MFVMALMIHLDVYSTFQIDNDPTRIQQMGGDYIDDVIIHPGNMVIVVQQVNMGEGKKIVVSKGAVLIINGQVISTLYKKCSNCEYNGETKLWYGIEVLGDNGKSQDLEHKIYCDNKLATCFEFKYDDWGRRVYTNSNPQACLGNRNQGMLYVKNSKIEYSMVGIVAGTVPVKKIFGTNIKIPNLGSLARENGGALMIIEDSEFKNNRYGSVMFADYIKYSQLSHVMNNTIHITNDFITQFALPSGKECRYIAMSLNNFKYNISGNTLTSESKKSNYRITGIYLVQSNAKMRSNLNISNLNIGISANAYSPGFNMGSSFINYNVLSSNNIGIHLQGVDKMNVNFNTIKISGENSIASSVIKIAEKDYGSYVQIWDLLTNNALGTYADGAFNLSYNKNSHQMGSSGSVNRTWGVYFSNANNTSGYVKNNTFNGLYNASFFNSGNNNYVNVLCNKYNSTFSDLVVENIKNTGIRNIGTYTSPAGNSFQPNVRVNTCVTFESVKNNVYGTALLNYHYSSTWGQNSAPISTFGVKINSSIKTPNCFDTYVEPFGNVPCEKQIIIKPNEKKALYLDAHENFLLANMRLEQEESVDNHEEFVFNKSAYDQSLADLLNHYAESSQLDSLNKLLYRDSIHWVLQNHNTFAGKYYLTQFYVENQQWSEAEGVLSQLESSNNQDTLILQYCEYMRMMIDFASSGWDTSWLRSHFEEIKAIADQGTHMMSAKAKVLVQLAAESDESNEFHDSILYEVKIPILVMDQDSTVGNDSMDLLIYPNPASDDLNVVLDNFVPKLKTYNWVILSQDGSVVKTGELVFNNEAVATVKIDVSSLDSQQFYYFKLLDGTDCVKSASIKKI
jgi:hypothetical protein